MNRLSWLVRVAPLFAVAVATWSFGCSDDRPPISGDCTPTTNIPCTAPPAIGGTGGSGGCGFTSTVAACNDCIAQNCCSSGTACSQDLSCVALSQCLNACIPDGSTVTDSTCAELCESQQDAGISLYQTFVSCVQSGCPICE